MNLHRFALGNLDNVGGSDVAAILVSRPGGSGAFYELHLLVENEGKVVHSGSVFLGDRIKLECLLIDKSVMTLRWLTREALLVFDAPPRTPVTKYTEVSATTAALNSRVASRDLW